MFGIVTALLERDGGRGKGTACSRKGSGKGQVIDCAMTDGLAQAATLPFKFMMAQTWSETSGENMLDGGAYYYGTYTCKDSSGYVAVGPLECVYAVYVWCGVAQRERGLRLMSACPLTRRVECALHAHSNATNENMKRRPKFFEVFEQTLSRCGALPEGASLPPQDDRNRWDEGRDMLSAAFLTKTRDEW